MNWVAWHEQAVFSLIDEIQRLAKLLQKIDVEPLGRKGE